MARRYVLGASLLLVLAAAAVLLLNRSSTHAPSAAVSAASQARRDTANATPKPLTAATFTTSYPGSYTLAVKHSSLGAARYQLSSTGAPANSVEIPPAGTVAVTIDETPTSLFRNLHLAGALPDSAASIQTPVQLMPNFVGTPARAAGVVHVLPVHAVTLDRAAAAEEAYTYTFNGRQNVQVDVLSRRHGQVVNIELDAEAALSSASRAALEMITGSWRWR